MKQKSLSSLGGFFLVICSFSPFLGFSASGFSQAIAAENVKKSSLKKTDSKKAKWNKRMQELSKTLSSLLIDVTNFQRYNDPKNFKQIERNVKKFADLAHSLEVQSMRLDSTLPDPDPSIVFMASLFESEAKRAYQALKSGNRSYARSILKTVSSYCIACHTHNSGGKFQPIKDADLASFSRTEKADVLAATRQFDKALKEYQAIARDMKFAKTKQLDWERAVRNAVGIAVRIKRDPDLALKIVDVVTKTPGVPGFFKEDAMAWKRSIEKWKEEPKKSLKTEEGLIAEARRLIAEAHSMQKYPADNAADILYLRASDRVHELLRVAPNGKYSTEALFIAGVSYEALRDLNLWSLHEMYYESCIRKSPHTEIAQSCYRRYEETIYAGYSGSGGTAIPADVAKRLSELRSLAKSEVQAPK